MKNIIITSLTVLSLVLIGGCGNSSTASNSTKAEAGTTETTVSTTAVAETEQTTVTASETQPVQTTSPTTAAESVRSTATNSTTAAASDYIGEDEAKSVALSHAGVTADDVTFIKAKLDHDDGIIVYDVEFYKDNAEYDYEIDAYTGSILSYDYDIENYTNTGAQSTDTSYIGEEEAKTIALTKAGLTQEQVTFTKVSFEYDNGIAVYQIEFIHEGMEYEIEINAESGAVTDYELDSI